MSACGSEEVNHPASFYKTSPPVSHPDSSPSSSPLRKAPEKQSEVLISPEGSNACMHTCRLLVNVKAKLIKMWLFTQ